MHLGRAQIEKVREPGEQMSRMGVPEEFLNAHAFHTYRLTSPDNSSVPPPVPGPPQTAIERAPFHGLDFVHYLWLACSFFVAVCSRALLLHVNRVRL